MKGISQLSKLFDQINRGESFDPVVWKTTSFFFIEDKSHSNIELQKKASVLDQIDELLINLKSDTGKEELMKALNEKEPQNNFSEGEGGHS